MNNVVRMPSPVNKIAEVIVIKPRDLAEMPQVIQSLQASKTVVLNLSLMTPEQAQRAVDFVVGGTYAIQGDFEHLGQTTLLLTPSCVQLSTDAGRPAKNWGQAG